MKECKECEYFSGWDYSDGTPRCDYSGTDGAGYESCPYCDSAPINKNGIKIEINAQFMSDYIFHTLKNTMENESVKVATDEIEKIIDENLKDFIFNEMKSKVSSIVDKQVDKFMEGKISVGGGWAEPARELTREEYLSETIAKELESRFKSDSLKKYSQRSIEEAINQYSIELKKEVNKSISTYFDAATREVLTNNVVNMLMSNETYQKLSNSMKTFLPETQK